MSFALPRMIGLSTMMYAIAKNVANPPRNSRATVDPRSEILKNRSRLPWGCGAAGGGESTGAVAEGGMGDLSRT
ncbi:hypothetical protein SBADM41S_08624 [Streptomyces badius]